MARTWKKAKWVGALVGGLALLATGVGRWVPRAAPEEGGLPVARSPTRSLEARLTWPEVDGYRPYAAPDAGGGDAAPEPLPLQWLAQLEKAGDVRGLATVSLLEGNLGTAAHYLERAPASPEVDSDRAVLALERGEPALSLALLERVLQRAPNHPQALWNRALVLEELQLWASAATAFEAAAALSEPGWSEEAHQRATQLRARCQREQQDWSRSGRSLVEGTSLPSEAQVRERPGYFRRSFYDALRAARTPEQLQALEPVATALDAHFGGTVLRQALAWTRARDLRHRAPLAEFYLHHLLQEPYPPHDHRQDLERLRAAGEPDLFMGALVLTRSVGAYLPEFQSLAEARGDPWLLLQAEEYRAEAAIDRGDLLEAEQVLVPAVRRCREQGLAFRCAYLLRQLGRLYRQRHWPDEAMRHTQEALELTRRERMWGVQPSLLMELGQLARFRQQNALARAWLNEALAREPGSCLNQRFVHENNADVLLNELAVPQARQELAAALRCGLPLSPAGATALARLSRLAPEPGDAGLLARSLEDIRSKKGLEASELALTYTIEGRFFLAKDRAAGEALLRKAIAGVERLPRWDATARKARGYSYTSLMREAAQAGEFPQVLALMEEEARERLPGRCLLGVAAEAEWLLAVVRGPEGQLLGHHETGRTAQPDAASRLLPETLLAPLRACERVAVVARPPLHGRAELLPPEVAWSYFMPRPAARLAPPLSERRLVVADVQAPSHLGLAPLRAWARPPRGARVLAGPEATPTRVLEEMEQATDIEVHAHGLVSSSLSDASVLVLSPEPEGRYALSVGELRSLHLRGRPLVTLASCRAAHTGPVLHEPFSLPVAFLEAGARAVLAATVDVPDAEATPFFEAVLTRIRAGVHPAIAVRDVRVEWLARDPDSWVRAVLVFD
jgi:tetratricopeptide (TPR) repeat protein